MRWVPAAAVRPNRCAFIPFIGSHHPRGFFDFGTEIMAFDGHAYCSVVAAEQMAAAMGWAPAGDSFALKQRVRELEDQVAQKADEMAALQAQVDAVHTLRQAGYEPARKPGRPRKQVA
jgi:hypothetical protein